MTKRIVTKIGDVFQTKGGRILQLVAIDNIQLNSDVVIIYQKIKLNSVDDIHSAPIDFYHHTTVSEGIKQSLWVKIGKTKIPNISELCFKTYFDKELAELVPFDNTNTKPYWMVWRLSDNEWRYFNEKQGTKLIGEEGSIVPPDDIIFRINHGVSQFTLNWPK
jgi:hypothetical protein